MGVCGCSPPRPGGCPACRGPEPDQNYPTLNPMRSAPVGWQCPGCGACFAPSMLQCQYCGPRVRTGISTQ